MRILEETSKVKSTRSFAKITILSRKATVACKNKKKLPCFTGNFIIRHSKFSYNVK